MEGKKFHAQKIGPLPHLNKIMVCSYSPILVGASFPRVSFASPLMNENGPGSQSNKRVSQPHGFGIF